jgi:hypothetical protein
MDRTVVAQSVEMTVDGVMTAMTGENGDIMVIGIEIGIESITMTGVEVEELGVEVVVLSGKGIGTGETENLLIGRGNGNAKGRCIAGDGCSMTKIPRRRWFIGQLGRLGPGYVLLG